VIEPTPAPPPPASSGLARAAAPTLAFLTDDALRAVYDRVAELAPHVEGCCAANQCRYVDGYERLYDVLALAGLPGELVPLDRARFEEWLTTRPRP
jgi:hypothetical protein